MDWDWDAAILEVTAVAAASPQDEGSQQGGAGPPTRMLLALQERFEAQAQASARREAELMAEVRGAKAEAALLRDETERLRAELARAESLNGQLITSLRQAVQSRDARALRASPHAPGAPPGVRDIAAKFGSTPSELRKLNGASTDARLLAKATILIPITSQALAWEKSQR
ncbi:uncharacterized protein AMSG_05597 [Thecamonas trahens ATCC 50062]|uniref:LysM domain-containing protein n=1 Tax=Thecamonas trahens ATCC 50062 TaxID=461836 RepID=A0A0L0DBW8_THETB|nr:hypothetical protein AMSG_05597 [Thecamonas trahens ATCC 50062]KNC49561.1 hypothetical protein AMSG_05597 [Thecamonas trahens ATCC 50062]|eukprot:XP_013757670.1 hypothetical protein AMSG_05597 [Thecamonas trahens ATCC 50062]